MKWLIQLRLKLISCAQSVELWSLWRLFNGLRWDLSGDNSNVHHYKVHHYNDVIMSAIASQITSLTIDYSTVDSGADQRKHQSSASLAFVWVTGEFPAQMASNAENVSIWWRHHVQQVSCRTGGVWMEKEFHSIFYRVVITYPCWGWRFCVCKRGLVVGYTSHPETILERVNVLHDEITGVMWHSLKNSGIFFPSRVFPQSEEKVYFITRIWK